MNDIKVRRRKLSDYKQLQHNANQGTVRGLAMHEQSVDQFGAARSAVADVNDVFLAGNHTAERLYAAGIEDVIEIETNGKQFVVVKRPDLDANTEQGKAYSLYDNRVGELNLAWDADELTSLQSDLDLSQFFDPDELAAILADAADEPPGDPGAAISRAEEWQAKWSCERGQVWQIGRHRLAVGSAYDAALVARLLDGKTPDMLHIDPPYGISIVKPVDGSSAADSGGAKPFGKTGAPGNRAIPDRAVGATGETKRSGANAVAERNRVGSVRTPHAKGARTTANLYPTMKGDQKPDVLADSKHIEVYGKAIIQSNLYPVIEGDDTPFDPTLFTAYAPVVVMWGANYYADRLPISSGWICWDKREDITRNNFADGELAWTNQQKPMRIFHHLWNGLHKGSQHGERRLHPTEKPVALFEEVGRLFADGGLWLDLFAGSGPQLVAAERTGATCYAAEIEVLYCATILERLSQMGLSVERVP